MVVTRRVFISYSLIYTSKAYSSDFIFTHCSMGLFILSQLPKEHTSLIGGLPLTKPALTSIHLDRSNLNLSISRMQSHSKVNMWHTV